MAAERPPQRLAVVQVERNDGAAPLRGLHRLARDLRRRLRQRAEDAAGVQPPGTFALEDGAPVDVARLAPRHGGMAAIGAADARADATSALDEVEPVSRLA